jgi:prolyl-tRNA editing enzyme YbaK/EbsC (Cys-tRNA(Pro) deacylase)
MESLIGTGSFHYRDTVKPWPEPVERVASYLRMAGIDARLEEFPDGTPTAAAAARAVGCTRAEIVKSLVFVADGKPVLALVPGDKRADPARLSADARVARPEEVVAATGFEPGAVAPFPVPNVSRVFMDRSFLRHELVWIGAGSDRHMAGLAPNDLARLAKAEIGEIAEP